MKRKRIIALATALLLLTLTACSDKAAGGETTTEPPSTSAPPTTVSATEPPAAKVSEQDITVKSTPVSLTQRPEFAAKDLVSEDEFVSLHGYAIGMTFAETQAVWKIPQDMVNYAAQRLEAADASSLYIYIGNMAYDFAPAAGVSGRDYDSFVLRQIYYGEAVFCENREALSVLRDIELGDIIEDALKSLPGKRTPKKWAIDQLYGEKGKPNSASLEYNIKTGFYDLKIYGENNWIWLTFGSSGKLWYAEVRPINN